MQYPVQGQMSLVLTEPDSCLPTAINLYFGLTLFSSIQEFFDLQTKNSVRKRSITEFDDMMLAGRVYAGRYYYRLETLFSSEGGFRLPPKMHSRWLPHNFLVWYTKPKWKYGHIEAVQWDGKEFSLLRNKSSKLEFLKISIAECFAGTAQLRYTIYRYKREV